MVKIKWLILLSALTLLTACSKENEIQTLTAPSPEQKLVTNEQGLTFSILEDQYEEGMPLFHTKVKNDSKSIYEYGEYYQIEVLKNDEWYTLTHSNSVFYENPHFTNLGNLIAPGKEIQQSFSVETLGVTLVPGQYRLVKIFLTPIAPYYTITLAVPFTVTSKHRAPE
ncbi:MULTISPECIES: immunoglobulin-like domain-containing protein [unclassified Sporosarcina]|uniref:immunoglobulin-like domain-containing protein n=1 Tax=unclassified Sporosarcina TaxID=2647733 RepID=UPI000C16B739|nr:MULTISPECIES: immunoglobulin-like domain-containing protein [unclassified Sporosarcina]PID06915.1 hypothetical protein CSV66_03205 [Sporosarcina sp. P30]PID10109.1 hypothetical protein CSV65_03205 [Sporosarcina sp. P31]PID13688.1 hypothetical protein CSV64_01240 [Sporosarcina sp. P32b]